MPVREIAVVEALEGAQALTESLQNLRSFRKYEDWNWSEEAFVSLSINAVA